MKAKYIIGGIIIVVFLIWGTSAFLKTTIQYVSLDEAFKARRTVQVMGKIDFNQVKYNSADTRLEFAVFDPEAKDTVDAKRYPIVYYGVVPGNFDQAKSVVLKGKADDKGVFIAEQMLVKCPSKYQGTGGEFQDIRNDKADSAKGA